MKAVCGVGMQYEMFAQCKVFMQRNSAQFNEPCACCLSTKKKSWLAGYN